MWEIHRFINILKCICVSVWIRLSKFVFHGKLDHLISNSVFFSVHDRCVKANSACVVYFWMKPNTQDMYVGKSMRGFDVRMKEHYSNIVNSSNRNQIPGYNLIRRAGLGEWIQFPLCLVHASNDFEMRIEMRILERDFIICLSTVFEYASQASFDPTPCF